MFVVILAQSAATSRAYAAKYEEEFSEDTDLVGLGAANVAAAFSGTFVVNGSPTKAQIVDTAGGRSQLSPLTASAVVLLVLVLLTGPLAYLPDAALAAVVFLIAVELIDVKGMRRILACRKRESAVALLTTAAVVALGVEYGIVLAVVASIVDHLRHSYSPLNSILVKSPAGHWHAAPVVPGARTEEGLVVYRFGTSLYYANAAKLVDDVADAGRPRRPAAVAGHRLRRHRRRRLHRVHGPGQGRWSTFTSGTCAWCSAPCSARCGSNSTATASARPWALTPSTTLPARPSRPSMRPTGPQAVRAKAGLPPLTWPARIHMVLISKLFWYRNRIKREGGMAPSGQMNAPALQTLLEDAALTGTWTLDAAKSTVRLRSRSMWGMVPVKGVFRQASGQGTVSPAGAVSGTVTVSAASIDTKNKKRDTHLRSADFFDSDTYPDITVTVDGARPSGQGVTVSGSLTVRDRTRPVAFDAQVSVISAGEVSLDAEVQVDRSDFGLTWSPMRMSSMHNAITVHAVFTRH